MSDIKPGWAVLGNDGRRFGSVRSVSQNFLIVSRSTGSSDAHVPSSAIGNVQDEAVHLNLAKREADGMGWEQPPRETDEPTGSTESDLHRHV